jgi:hypothetical protein
MTRFAWPSDSAVTEVPPTVGTVDAYARRPRACYESAFQQTQGAVAIAQCQAPRVGCRADDRPCPGAARRAVPGALVQVGSLSPLVAEIIGAGRSWTAWTISVLSIPSR